MSCPECKELREVVTAQSVLIAELQAKVEQLSRDSSNSSQPPSQDRKFAPRKSTRKRSGRKKGGQIGREGAYRQFEKADKVVELIPTHCDFCEATLDGSDESPWRHQVVELPVVKPEVTEYLRHGLCCQGCGKKTHAKLPQGVTPSSFGPRLTALVGMLSGGYGLTKRKIQTLLGEVFSVKLSLGSIPAMERRVSHGVKKPVEEILRRLKNEKRVWLDETPLPRYELDKSQGYLWVGAAENFVCFSHAASREGYYASNLIGADFQGILHSDRYKVYEKWDDWQRQICWAHLIRNFRSISLRQGKAGEVGAALLEKAQSLIHQFHRFQSGEITESTLKAYTSKHRVDIRLALEEGQALGKGNQTAGTCRKVLEHETALYTFVRRLDLGVDTTNNFAERQLRPAVIWRKNSFGTHSKEGSLFVSRILSVVQTLRLQGRDLFEWLIQSTQDYFFARQTSLSLLPEPT